MLFGCAKEKVHALDCEDSGKYLLYPEKNIVTWVTTWNGERMTIDYELQTYPDTYIITDDDFIRGSFDRSSLVLKQEILGKTVLSQCYLDQPKI